LRPPADSRVVDYEGHIKSTCDLTNTYLTSVGRGCNLILNLSPDWLGAVTPAVEAAYAALGAAVKCLASAPLASAAGLVLFDEAAAPPLNNGTSVWTLPAPLAGQACGQGSSCFSLSLRLAEEMASAGQRIGAWAVAGCFAASPPCAADGWLPLTSAQPAAAATSIGARRFVRLEAEVPGGSARLSALRFDVLTAYAWGGAGGAKPGTPPLVLSKAELFDWSGAAACVPANCSLVAY
jgi:hypothetical protein